MPEKPEPQISIQSLNALENNIKTIARNNGEVTKVVLRETASVTNTLALMQIEYRGGDDNPITVDDPNGLAKLAKVIKALAQQK